MCTVLLPPGGNPIAVNKYIISLLLPSTTLCSFSVVLCPVRCIPLFVVVGKFGNHIRAQGRLTCGNCERGSWLTTSHSYLPYECATVGNNTHTHTLFNLHSNLNFHTHLYLINATIYLLTPQVSEVCL